MMHCFRSIRHNPKAVFVRLAILLFLQEEQDAYAVAMT
jgi:hypothetical protein